MGDKLSLGEIVGKFKSYTTSKYLKGAENRKWQSFYENCYDVDIMIESSEMNRNE
jgi:hypothetical protein